MFILILLIVYVNIDIYISQYTLFGLYMQTIFISTEYASSSDSYAETPVIDQAWRGDGDSDAESIDSEQEDPLK